MKKHYKFILGIVIGLIISGIVGYAQTVLTSKEVVYDNTNSKLSSTNVKDAIDEVNTKATTKLKEAKASCPDGKKCITEPSSFKSDSWETIANAVRLKDYPYQVGDTKEIDMGSLGTHTVRVANTSSCTNGETSETACGFVVEFADIISRHAMNSIDTNVGGWPASEMRTYVNGTIYNVLPSELQNVIATTTVVSGHGSTSGETNFTSSDKLYLLSPKEIYNNKEYDTVEAETRQLDYYKNKGVTDSNYSGAIKQYNGTEDYWWLRAAVSSNIYNFAFVYIYGATNQSGANSREGVSPAFRIA